MLRASRKTAALAAAALAVLSAPADADAETEEELAAALVAEGERLGQEGRFPEALDAFRSAEKTAANPIHDCYIAIAYARLKSFGAARYHLDQCSARADTDTPIEWYPAARAEIDAATANHGRVTLTASVADARIRVASIPSVVIAAPVTLWLLPGRHAITIEAPGHQSESREVEVKAQRGAAVEFELVAAIPMTPPTPPRGNAPPQVDKRPSLTPGAVVVGVGVAGLVVGGVFHSRAFAARDRAKPPQSDDEFARNRNALKRNERIAYAAYGVSAVAIGVGAYLIVRARRAPRVLPSASVDGGGDRLVVSLVGRF